MLGILRASGLDVAPGAIAATLGRYPDASPLEAAHTVMAWWHGGRTRTSRAAALLDCALGSQRRRVRSQEGPADPRPAADAEGWEPVAAELRRRVPDFKFHIWLAPLELVASHGQELVVRAPEHIRTWVSQRYVPLVVEAARAAGVGNTVQLVGDDWRPGAAPA